MLNRSDSIFFGSIKVNLLDTEVEHQDAVSNSTASSGAGSFPKPCLKSSVPSHLDSDSSAVSTSAESSENPIHDSPRKLVDSAAGVQNLNKQNSNSTDVDLLVSRVINPHRRSGICSRCFGFNHFASSYVSLQFEAPAALTMAINPDGV